VSIRTLIVDDERPARAKIRRLLEGDARFAIVGEAADGFRALELVEEHEPELVFLDIQMPGIDGFEVLDAMGPERQLVVVFSTAHDEHALRAFDAHALDYLLKPYDQERFQAALEKAYRHVAGSVRTRTPASAARRLVVKCEAGWVAISLDDLLRISADDKQALLFLGRHSLRVRNSLSSLERRLDAGRFVRVHRGEIVRIDAVVRYEANAHGDGILTLTDGSAVALSRTRREEFVRRFRKQE
jgi:two-component system LytT family response regulator